MPGRASVGYGYSFREKFAPQRAGGLALKGGFMALGLVMPPTGQQSELQWLLLAPMLALSLASSAVLFLVIERPFSLAPRTSHGAPTLVQAASASESGS